MKNLIQNSKQKKIVKSVGTVGVGLVCAYVAFKLLGVLISIGIVGIFCYGAYSIFKNR